MNSVYLFALKHSRALLLVVVMLAMFLISCNKSNRETWAYYDETYCSDKWPQSGNNETLKQNIIDYFKPKGVEIFDIEIFVDRDPESSAQCYNKTGRRVRVRINKSDVETVKSNGFYE